MYRIIGLTAGFMMGVWAGAAAGLLAGILFAPRKGEETRERIRRKVTEARARTLDQIAQKKQAVQHKAGKAAEAAHDALDKTESKVAEATGEERSPL